MIIIVIIVVIIDKYFFAHVCVFMYVCIFHLVWLLSFEYLRVYNILYDYCDKSNNIGGIYEIVSFSYLLMSFYYNEQCGIFLFKCILY